MWHREYRDYETDKPLIKSQVESGRGIIGCEMHDLNGWGQTIHVAVKKRRRGIMSLLFSLVFGAKNSHERS